MTYPPPPEAPSEFPPPPSQYGQQPYYGGQIPPSPANNSGLWGVLGFTLGVVITLVVTGFLAPGFFLEKNTSTASASPSPTSVTSTAAAVADPGERAPIPRHPDGTFPPATCEYPATPDQPAAKAVNPPPNGEVPPFGTASVIFKSTAGDIELVLDRSLAPCAVNSFLSLARQGFYTGTSCHRLSADTLQMLQCGDPWGTGTGGPGYSFKDETYPELTYGRGILAMANAGPDTNGSQFFMVYGDAPLPPDYDVFGSVSGPGLQVLDKVAKGGIDPASTQGSPDGTGKPKIPVTFNEVVVGP
jgi:peptidyl-prolyl cis-trans isomerase B (cyclophilin B)